MNFLRTKEHPETEATVGQILYNCQNDHHAMRLISYRIRDIISKIFPDLIPFIRNGMSTKKIILKYDSNNFPLLDRGKIIERQTGLNESQYNLAKNLGFEIKRPQKKLESVVESVEYEVAKKST